MCCSKLNYSKLNWNSTCRVHYILQIVLCGLTKVIVGSGIVCMNAIYVSCMYEYHQMRYLSSVFYFCKKVNYKVIYKVPVETVIHDPP
jgi:hypothetical protein